MMAQALGDHDIPNAWLASSKHKKSYSADADKVAVLSIHSSKGLEFQTVVILDASFERADTTLDAPSLDDSMRLLYVGMTRARERLLISCHRANTISKTFEINALS
jgi:ATP-dependent exoDNAse (exonuclease V) beta subunit